MGGEEGSAWDFKKKKGEEREEKSSRTREEKEEEESAREWKSRAGKRSQRRARRVSPCTRL